MRTRAALPIGAPPSSMRPRRAPHVRPALAPTLHGPLHRHRPLQEARPAAELPRRPRAGAAAARERDRGGRQPLARRGCRAPGPEVPRGAGDREFREPGLRARREPGNPGHHRPAGPGDEPRLRGDSECDRGAGGVSPRASGHGHRRPQDPESGRLLEYSARAFPDHLTFLFNRYSLLTRLFPENRFSRRYLLTDWDHASVRQVDWLSGACLMVRREAIDRVGPMDEAFFLFNEDVDWCRRMRLAGWAVTYVPEAVVVHHIGASKAKVDPRVIFERHRGMIHYFHKHHPAPPPVSMLADALIMFR